MAIQIETQGQLQEFLEILRKRVWQVVLPAAFVIALGSAFAVLVPKKYLATTQVELRPVSMSVSSKEASNAPFQIPSPQRVKKVVQELKNTDYLALAPEERQDFLEGIQKNAKVRLLKGPNEATNFVNIEYADVNPDWTVAFLKALRDDWIEDVLERDRNKLDDEREKLQEEKSKLEKQHLHEEQLLTDLKREHGISATQPIPGAADSRSEDPIYERLQSNQTQLNRIEVEVASLRAKIDMLEKRYAEMPEKLTRDELVGGVKNEAELKAVDLELLGAQEALKGYRPEHSKYKQTVEKIEALEKRREQLTQLVTKGELQTVASPNPERARLRTEIEKDKLEVQALEAQQKKLAEGIDRDLKSVNELQAVYKEIRVRADLISRLSAALEDVERRYQDKVQQVKMISSPLANPFDITADVTRSNQPVEPNPFLIIAIAVVGGLGIGIGLAITLEYSKNCFRSVHDISRVMAVPVLGSINTIVTRREARLRAAKRTVVGVSSAVLIGSLVFITWAWAKNPELLSPDVRSKIEELRANFR